MIQVLLDVNGYKLLELYSNDPVNLNYRFSDISQVNAATSSFSQTFRVPLTKQNTEIFGEVTLGQVPEFRYKSKIPARIQRAGITIFEGYAQVKGFYQQKGQYTDVEVTVFGETADLSRGIGEGTLQDLDLTALDTVVNGTNVSVGLSAAGLHGGKMRLGVVDRGHNWNENNSPFQEATPITFNDLTPFVSIQTVVDAIFIDAGYTYESTWLDSQTNTYLMALAGSGVYSTAIYQRNALYIGRTTNQSVLAGTWTNLTLSETGAFYDDITGWNLDTFSAPITGYYEFEFYLFPSVYQTYSFRWVGSTAGTSGTITGTTSSLTTNRIQFTLTILLEQFETVNFQVQAATAFNLVGVSNDRSSTRILLRQYWQTEGYTLNVARNLPDLKQIEFLNGLQKAFNLVFIPDRLKPKHYYVEPFTQYLTLGAVKDWTEKIDLTKDLQVTPTTDDQARKYVWKLSESEDLVNAAAKETEGEVYGTFTINDTGNAFSKGNKEISTVFAPFVTQELDEVPVFKLLKATNTANAAIEKPKPFLCFYNGFESGNVFLTSYSSGNFDEPVPFFSAYSQYRVPIPNKADSLFYGYPAPFHEVNGLPLYSLYYRYWSDWYNSLYSEDARQLTAYFLLTTEDVATFEFSDKIFLFNQYWRVLEISNFDATQDTVTQVKLLKVLGAVRDCAELPTTSLNGIISGDISSLSKTCCERYGYTYDPDTLRCLIPPIGTL